MSPPPTGVGAGSNAIYEIPLTTYEKMNEQRILEELLALLEANGVAIRTEPLGGSGGGLCTIKGRPTFFVDTQAASSDVAPLCAAEIPQRNDIESIDIRPE